MQYIRLAFGEVLRKPAYTAAAAVSALAIFLLATTAPNIKLIVNTPGLVEKLSIMLLLIKGLPSSTSTAFWVSIPILSILFGINVALLAYSFKNISMLKGSSGATTGGFIAGLLGTGCPACGSALLSAFGLSGALAALPFQGQFIAPLSVILMLVAIHFSAKSIAKCDVCFVKPKENYKNLPSFK